MDWQEPAAGVVGGLFVTVFSWLLGRSDSAKERHDKQVRALALDAVRESEEFVRQGEQRLINQQLRDDVAAVKETVNGIDRKLDAVLLGGHLHRRNED